MWLPEKVYCARDGYLYVTGKYRANVLDIEERYGERE